MQIEYVRRSNPSHSLRGLLVVVCLFAASHVAGAEDVAPQQARLQAITDQFRSRLDISPPVQVSIVPVNKLLMSVEPVEGSTPRVFHINVEGDFAEGLDDGDASAALAHELGHVWIFTHHPFLQTEQLANQIALKVVSRDALTQLYDKVWKRGDTRGDLAVFLGLQSPAGLPGAGAQ